MPSPPRRKKHRNRPPGEDAKKRVRAQQALELRAQGHTYRMIGIALNVSEKTAFLDVQEELARLDAVIKQQAERVRELEATRLDRLTLALEPAIATGDPRAVGAAVRVMERRAKLLGLDAPTTITAPEGAPLAIRIVHQELKD